MHWQVRPAVPEKQAARYWCPGCLLRSALDAGKVSLRGDGSSVLCARLSVNNPTERTSATRLLPAVPRDQHEREARRPAGRPGPAVLPAAAPAVRLVGQDHVQPARPRREGLAPARKATRGHRARHRAPAARRPDRVPRGQVRRRALDPDSGLGGEGRARRPLRQARQVRVPRTEPGVSPDSLRSYSGSSPLRGEQRRGEESRYFTSPSSVHHQNLAEV